MERQTKPDKDLDLVRRVRRGDRAATGAFLERMRCVPRMVAVKNRRLGCPFRGADLEDLSQEVLLAVWRKLGKYRGSAPLEGWVFPFVQNEVLYRLRKRRRVSDLPEQEDAGPMGQLAEAEGAEHLEEVEMLDRALDRVGPPEADVIRMKHINDLTFREISELRGVDPSAIKAQYYRGIDKVRQFLGSKLQGDGEGRS